MQVFFKKSCFELSVNTVETLATNGGGLKTKSTIEMQLDKWSTYHLKELFYRLINN